MKTINRNLWLAAFAVLLFCSFGANAFSQIDMVYPQMNSQIFPANDNLFIRFTYDMNGSTINNSTVILRGSLSGRINASVYYDAYLKTAYIDPVRNLQPTEKIRLVLTSDIQTLQGYNIGPFYYWFKVKPLGGNGDFTETTSSQLTTNPISGFATGDFDSDGDLDLLVTVVENNNNNMFIYKNDGSGTFSDSSAKTTLESGYGMSYVWDYDNDGDLDVLCVYSDYWGSFYAKTYKNNGAGEFSDSYTVSNWRVKSMEVGDIDNDGDMDIALLGEHSIYFYWNNGDGAFNLNYTIWVACQYYYMAHGGIAMDDFDGDGDPDIYYAATFREEEPGYVRHITRLFYNTGYGSFETHFPGFYYEPRGSVTDDLNGDRKMDIMIPFYNIIMFSPSFSVRQGISLYTTGDFDGDGDLDLINPGALNELPAVHYNNGEGYFSSSGSGSSESQGGGFPCGDFDGDGDLDVFKAGSGLGQYIVYQNYTTCSIEGPTVINLDSVMIRFHTSGSAGYWTLTNNPPCNASIAGNNSDDTVYINAGSSEGSFLLSFYFPDSTLRCSRTISVDNPLPVELLSLTSSVIGRNVRLQWTTSSELNNKGFEVQQSSVQQSWNIVGFISGAGNSTESKSYVFDDKYLITGIYHYRLKQIDFNGNFRYYELPEAVTIGVPDKYFVDQNYPNPFNPLTIIAYGIPTAARVELKIYDMTGREITTLVNEFKEAGYYVTKLDGSSLASGTYIYRIESGDFVSAKKMMLLK